MIASYPHIVSLGHAALGRELFAGSTIVEEKIDGSQISFGVDTDETLSIRSKGAEIDLAHPDNMFKPGVETIRDLHQRGMLRVGWTYRGEYLRKPHHNTLKYNRIPKGHIIVFDINIGLESYLNYFDMTIEAGRIGLEHVPLLMALDGRAPTASELEIMLDMDSVLGGCKIEGVVFKPASYDLFGRDGKCVMAKYVSERFKENHRVQWKQSNPGNSDIIEAIGASLATEARWEKAVQHLRDADRITRTPKDIGGIIHEIVADIVREEQENIKASLWQWAMGNVTRKAVKGVAEWYKQRLAQEMINDTREATDVGIEVFHVV